MKRCFSLTIFIAFYIMSLMSCSHGSLSNNDDLVSVSDFPKNSNDNKVISDDDESTDTKDLPSNGRLDGDLRFFKVESPVSENIFNTIFQNGSIISYDKNPIPSLLNCTPSTPPLLKMQTLTQSNFKKEVPCHELYDDVLFQDFPLKGLGSEYNRLILVHNQNDSKKGDIHIILLTKETQTERGFQNLASVLNSISKESVLSELLETHNFSVANPNSFYTLKENGKLNIYMKVKTLKKQFKYWAIVDKEVSLMQASHVLKSKEDIVGCRPTDAQREFNPDSTFMSIRRINSEYYFVLNFINVQNESASESENCVVVYDDFDKDMPLGFVNSFYYPPNDSISDYITNYFQGNKDAVSNIRKDSQFIPSTYSIIK